MSLPVDVGEIRSAARRVAARTAAAQHGERFRAFFDALRGSEIPWLAAAARSRGELYAGSSDALYVFGSASLPLAVGLTMHQYMFSAIATSPPFEGAFEERRLALVASMLEERRLIAVASIGDNVGTQRGPFTAERVAGGVKLTGRNNFQSIAGEADLMTVVAELPGEGHGLFVVARGQAGVRVSEHVFPGPMALADTRSVDLDGCVVPEERVLSLGDAATGRFLSYATSWFHALISAAYLGAAAAALEELRRFARSVKVPNGTTMSEVDGVKVEAGRLGVDLKASLALASSYQSLLATMDVDALYEESAVIKHVCTHAAERVVSGARALVGTRALREGARLAELSAQILFGPMHPLIDADLLRMLGTQVLGDAPVSPTG